MNGEKLIQSLQYKQFKESVKSMPWTGLTKRKTKKMDTLFMFMAFMRYSFEYNGFPKVYDEKLEVFVKAYGVESEFDMGNLNEGYLT